MGETKTQEEALRLHEDAHRRSGPSGQRRISLHSLFPNVWHFRTVRHHETESDQWAAATVGIQMTRLGADSNGPSLSEVAAQLFFRPSGRPRVTGGLTLFLSLSLAGVITRSISTIPEIFFFGLGLVKFSLWTFRLRLMAMGQHDLAGEFHFPRRPRRDIPLREEIRHLLEHFVMAGLPQATARKIAVGAGILGTVSGALAIVLSWFSVGWVILGGCLAVSGFYLMAAGFDPPIPPDAN